MTTPDYKLVYDDTDHAYRLNGRRCKSISKVAKIPTDTFALESWGKRMVAIGLATDAALIENVAAHIDNKKRLDDVCKQALNAARAHQAADRGTQMHRVLELILLNQEDRLLTNQQKADADVLKRTLDRYKLVPHGSMAEQFVIYPHENIAGRFDAILENANGDLILTDLKSGPNAVAFPDTTCIQLALYARAPFMSADIHQSGDTSTVKDWQQLPERLDRRYGYVLLVTPHNTVGTLHRIDIQHGWAGAKLALQAVQWRKALNWGKDIASEVDDFTPHPEPATWESLMESADTLERLREIWQRAKELNQLTPSLKLLAQRRSKDLR